MTFAMRLGTWAEPGREEILMLAVFLMVGFCFAVSSALAAASWRRSGWRRACLVSVCFLTAALVALLFGSAIGGHAGPRESFGGGDAWEANLLVATVGCCPELAALGISVSGMPRMNAESDAEG